MSARQWSRHLRIERRYGRTQFVAEFTDGYLRASLYGSLDTLKAGPSALQQAGWEAACEWMSHVIPNAHKPRREYQRIHFPVNHQRRKSHRFRRAA